MSGILSKADSVVIATGYAFSGVKRAVSTIDWLSQHGYEKLAQEAIVVLTDKDNVSIRVQKDMVRTTWPPTAGRCSWSRTTRP